MLPVTSFFSPILSYNSFVFTLLIIYVLSIKIHQLCRFIYIRSLSFKEKSALRTKNTLEMTKQPKVDDTGKRLG